MSLDKSKFPPNPHSARDWKSWAESLVRYLTQRSGVQQTVEPQAIMLASRIETPNVMEPKAVDDGVLMFNPELGLPEFSAGGAWNTLLAASGSQGGTVQTGSAAVVNEATVVFPVPYSSVPKIHVTVKTTLDDNEAVTDHVTVVTNLGFTVQLRKINTAFSQFVQPASADIDWMAVGSLT